MSLFSYNKQYDKWATSWQNQQNECAPSEDSDQPGHLPSLIRVFAVRMKKAWVLSYPLSAQRRLIRLGGYPCWSEFSLGAQPLCWFCHIVAQIILCLFRYITTMPRLESQPGLNQKMWRLSHKLKWSRWPPRLLPVAPRPYPLQLELPLLLPRGHRHKVSPTGLLLRELLHVHTCSDGVSGGESRV